MSENEKSVTEAASAAFEGVEGAVGLGVDIVEIARMRRILERTPSFREKVFSEEERSYCESTANPEVHYATRFAAKEAVLKALGTGFSRGIANHDVEVRRNAKGRPFVVLHGRAKEVADEQGVRELPLSLSYTHTDAVACALAITEESVRAQEESSHGAPAFAGRTGEPSSSRCLVLPLHGRDSMLCTIFRQRHVLRPGLSLFVSDNKLLESCIARDLCHPASRSLLEHTDKLVQPHGGRR